jgi:hypothetical protein
MFCLTSRLSASHFYPFVIREGLGIYTVDLYLRATRSKVHKNKLAFFCSAPLAGFYAAVDQVSPLEIYILC